MKIEEVLSQLDTIEKTMKTPQFEAALSERKLNLSFAVLIMEGLQAYLSGDVDHALSDLTTSVGEISARRERR